MLAHRRAHLGRDVGGAGQERPGAGLDPVGREHRPDQPVRPPVDPRGKGLRLLQPPQAPFLVKDRADRAFIIHHLPAGAVGGPQIRPQPQVFRRFRRRLEFLHRFAPLPVEERCNGQRRRDPIPDQLRKGEPLLERQFLGRIHLVGAARDIGFGPDAAGLPGREIVVAQNRGVEVRQRIEVDEPRRNHRLAEIVPVLHVSVEPAAHMQHLAAFDHDHAVFDHRVMAVTVADDPAGRK